MRLFEQGGGRPQSVSTTYPDVSRLSVLSAGLASLTGRLPARGCHGTASAGNRRSVVEGCGTKCRKERVSMAVTRSKARSLRFL